MGAWFFYNGNIPRSVTVKKGISVVVKPHSKVQIIDLNNSEVKLLIRKRLLRRCGKPIDSKNIDDIAEIVTNEMVSEVTEKSPMAKKIAEKGITKEPGIKPRMSSGKIEMTESEGKILLKKVSLKDYNKSIESVEKYDNIALENDESVEVLPAVDDDNVGKKKSRKNRK